MTKNNCNIRSMQTADLAAVFLIEQEQAFPWTHQVLEDCLQANYNCYVLEAGAAVIGFAILMMAGKQADILNIAVKTNFRRQGYGGLLLDYLLQTARQHSVGDIYLEVRSSNHAAIKLYEKYGFVVAGLRENYYRDNNGYENAIVMKKTIGSV